jgi:hypothetical protein
MGAWKIVIVNLFSTQKLPVFFCYVFLVVLFSIQLRKNEQLLSSNVMCLAGNNYKYLSKPPTQLEI